jgi:hypothetical protein
MRALFDAIPDLEVLLALEPEELGTKLLFLARAKYGPRMFHPEQMKNELWSGVMPGPTTYPGSTSGR